MSKKNTDLNSDDISTDPLILSEPVERSWKSFSLGFLDLSVQQEPENDSDIETKTLDSDSQNSEHFGYLLKEPLARGGQGTVWLAWQKNLDREVALKIHENQDPATFLHEAFTTAVLEHPNIVPVYDIGHVTSPDGKTRRAMSMKRVKGESWSSVLNQDYEANSGNLSPVYRKHLRILLSICNAVSYAHSRGILHLDLKPSQVIVGEFGEAYLMDWGLALNINHDQSDDNSSGFSKFRTLSDIRGASGTLNFMSPEQANADTPSINILTDVYLLGALTCYIATGKPPRSDADERVLLKQAQQNRFNPLPDYVPVEIQRIIRKAMSTSPSERHESVETFALEIDQFLQSQNQIFESQKILHSVTESVDPDSLRKYEDYHDALQKVDQALVLWKDNSEAIHLQQKIIRNHAAQALKHGDLKLASSLINRILDTETRKKFATDLAQAKRNKAQLRKQGYRLKALSRGLFGVLLILGSLSYYKISSSLKVAEESEQRALEFLGDAQYESAIGNLRAAATAIDANRPVVARNYLFDIPKEHRNWEWGFLLSASYPETGVLEPLTEADLNSKLRVDPSLNLKGRVPSVTAHHAYTDQDILAVGTESGEVLVFQNSSHEPAVFEEHNYPVSQIAIHPTRPLIASISAGEYPFDQSETRELVIRNFESGEESLRVEPRGFHPSSIDFHTGGEYLIVGLTEGSTVLLNENGWYEAVIIASGEGIMNQVIHDGNTDQNILISYNKVNVYNSYMGISNRIYPDSGTITNAELDPGGDELILSFESGIRKSYHATEGQSIYSYPFGGNPLSHITTARDVPIRVLATEKKHVVYLDLATASPDLLYQTQFPERAHSVSVTADGQYVLALLENGDLIRWSPAENLIQNIYSNESSFLMSSSSDGESVVLVMDKDILFLVAGVLENSIPHDLEKPVIAQWSNDDSVMIVGSEDGIIDIIDARSKSLIKTQQLYVGTLNDLCFDPESEFIAAAFEDGHAAIWDLENLESVIEFRDPNRMSLECIEFMSIGSNRIVTGGSDSFIRIWDTTTGREMAALEAHPYGVLECEFDHNLNFLTTWGKDLWIRTWKPLSWQDDWKRVDAYDDDYRHELNTRLDHRGIVNLVR